MSTLVCDTTMNAQVLGEADSEAAAVETLRAHFAGAAPIVGARVMPCQLAAADPEHGRAVGAWAPVTEPADVLAAAGRQLYGARWQAALARDLGVNEATIARWLSGKTPLPADHGAFEDILRIFAEHAETARALEAWRKRVWGRTGVRGERRGRQILG